MACQIPRLAGHQDSPMRLLGRIMSVKVFYLDREEDVSGVSGTGRVAEGIEFSNGKVIVHWPSDSPSTNIYENMKQMLKVHGHGGKLRVVVLFNEENADDEEEVTIEEADESTESNEST